MPTRPNERWSIDFMSDQLASGQPLAHPPTSPPASPGRASASWWPPRSPGPGWRSSRPGWARPQRHPKAVVCDNGPELTSKAMRFWSERSGGGAELHPARQAHPERLRGELQRQVPGQLPEPALVSRSLADVRRIVDDWRHHYNHERPHSSLGYSTPAERAKQAVPFYSLSKWTCFRGRVTSTIS